MKQLFKHLTLGVLAITMLSGCNVFEMHSAEIFDEPDIISQYENIEVNYTLNDDRLDYRHQISDDSYYLYYNRPSETESDTILTTYFEIYKQEERIYEYHSNNLFFISDVTLGAHLGFIMRNEVEKNGETTLFYSIHYLDKENKLVTALISDTYVFGARFYKDKYTFLNQKETGISLFEISYDKVLLNQEQVCANNEKIQDYKPHEDGYLLVLNSTEENASNYTQIVNFKFGKEKTVLTQVDKVINVSKFTYQLSGLIFIAFEEIRNENNSIKTFNYFHYAGGHFSHDISIDFPIDYQYRLNDVILFGNGIYLPILIHEPGEVIRGDQLIFLRLDIQSLEITLFKMENRELRYECFNDGYIFVADNLYFESHRNPNQGTCYQIDLRQFESHIE